MRTRRSSRRVVPFALVVLACLLSFGAPSGLAGQEPATPGSPTPASDAAAPAPDPGLYFLPSGAVAPAGLVRLHQERAEKMHQKGTVAMTLTFGVTRGHVRAVFSGAHAPVRVPAGSPAFFFYFGDTAGKPFDPNDPMAAMAALQSLGGDAPPPGADDAAQFELVRLQSEGDSRSVETGTVGGFRGSSGKSRDALDVHVEKLGAHEFKVAPAAPLAPGEYGFLFTGQGPSAQVWDFGVDAN
jgi:hypothetical protein